MKFYTKHHRALLPKKKTRGNQSLKMSIALANILIAHRKVCFPGTFLYIILVAATQSIKIIILCYGTVIVESNVSLDRLKTICAQMTKATNEFRRCLLEVKEVHARQVERLQRERDAALMAARVHADVDDSNNMHHIPGVELQTTKKVTADIHAKCQ